MRNDEGNWKGNHGMKKWGNYVAFASKWQLAPTRLTHHLKIENTAAYNECVVVKDSTHVHLARSSSASKKMANIAMNLREIAKKSPDSHFHDNRKRSTKRESIRSQKMTSRNAIRTQRGRK